jgi:hypothetical protein
MTLQLDHQNPTATNTVIGQNRLRPGTPVHRLLRKVSCPPATLEHVRDFVPRRYGDNETGNHGAFMPVQRHDNGNEPNTGVFQRIRISQAYRTRLQGTDQTNVQQ